MKDLLHCYSCLYLWLRGLQMSWIADDDQFSFSFEVKSNKKCNLSWMYYPLRKLISLSKSMQWYSGTLNQFSCNDCPQAAPCNTPTRWSEATGNKASCPRMQHTCSSEVQAHNLTCTILLGPGARPHASTTENHNMQGRIQEFSIGDANTF